MRQSQKHAPKAGTLEPPASPSPGAKRQVVLLDVNSDRPVGAMSKHAAHLAGRYHSAISVILVDRRGRQLLAQRALGKYHCPGMWSNACCSHPMPGETSQAAAERRLFEELRVRTPLRPLARVRYRARVGRLVEHECVDVFVGLCETQPRPDPKECAGVAWLERGAPALISICSASQNRSRSRSALTAARPWIAARCAFSRLRRSRDHCAAQTIRAIQAT
jgi:isopentenyl-diphosphate delta-isomerase